MSRPKSEPCGCVITYRREVGYVDTSACTDPECGPASRERHERARREKEIGIDALLARAREQGAAPGAGDEGVTGGEAGGTPSTGSGSASAAPGSDRS